MTNSCGSITIITGSGGLADGSQCALTFHNTFIAELLTLSLARVTRRAPKQQLS